MTNDGLDLLKMDFPIFEIRNTMPYAALISLVDGDSVQAQAYATIKVHSNKLYQLPDMTVFKMISPSIDDLISYGVITSTPAESKPVAPSSSKGEAKTDSTKENK